MSDAYKELLVKREKRTIDFVICIFCFILVGALFVLGLLMGSGIILVLAVGLGFITYLVTVPRLSVEFEYLYVDKELRISKIFGQTKRKSVDTLDLGRMEILAPADSYKLDNYKNRQAKVTDYSSGKKNRETPCYVMFYNGQRKLLFDFDADFIKKMQSAAPSKVFLK